MIKCPKSHSSKSPTSETSDTESAELRSTKFKKLPTFASIFKKKGGNSQQSAEGGRHENQNEDEQRLAAVTTENPQGTDGQEPKEDKQLVYAELVLKPSDDKPTPLQKDSTEYAEIVHVQKPATNDHPPNTAAK
ncbi:unnamed protein product [Hermetia illucens]|uniref:Uncharacterized protein n=1 Tax=Hermetia illucens TaxID=343691 RepID=A0A7R8UFL5_HERIL|nr:unnamed protein product [Hermetia illucens]